MGMPAANVATCKGMPALAGQACPRARRRRPAFQLASWTRTAGCGHGGVPPGGRRCDDDEEWMPVLIHVDTERRRVSLTLQDVISLEEMISTARTMAAHPGFGPG